MSNIPFLNNATQGKNNWWRYLITFFLTWGSYFLLGIVPLVVLLLIGIYTHSIDQNIINQILNSPLTNLLATGISVVIGFLVFYLCIKFIHHKKLISLITTGDKVNWRKIFKGAGVWLVILLALDLISYFISPQSVNISFNPQKLFLLAVLALLVFPIQASFEELFFRGYLLQGMGLFFKKPVWALLLTSIIFASMHILSGSIMVLSTLIIGITLGIIALADNGIELAIGVHIINNIYTGVLHSSPDAGLGSLPSLIVSPPNPLVSPMVLIIAAFFLLVILFRERREEVIGIFR
jgi:membrane protease YdiL (CAAX protease family)